MTIKINEKAPEYQFKYWCLFFVVVALYLVLVYLSNTLIYTDSFYYEALSKKLNIERVKDIITMQRKYQIIDYCIFPTILLLKLWFIAGIIFMALYLLNKDVSYQSCLKIVLIAELVSVVAMLVKVAWLMIHKPGNASDIQYFSPLSLTQLLNMDKLPKYFFYPLQLFNVFEVAYWLALAYGIMSFTNWKFGKSLKTVASSYGVALAVWVVIVVFIQVQFS